MWSTVSFIPIFNIAVNCAENMAYAIVLRLQNPLKLWFCRNCKQTCFLKPWSLHYFYKITGAACWVMVPSLSFYAMIIFKHYNTFVGFWLYAIARTCKSWNSKLMFGICRTKKHWWNYWQLRALKRWWWRGLKRRPWC